MLRSVVFLSPGRWFGFLARSSASPSVVVVDPLLRWLRFISYCLEKNHERCTRAEAHCFESFSSSRMFFILQMARGTSLFSSLVWWLERPLTCTRPTVLWAAVESATGFCYFVVFTIQAELPELKWSGRTCISSPHLIYFSNSCLVCTGVKMPLKGTVHPKIVHTSYLLQHAVSVYIVVRRAAEYQFWDTCLLLVMWETSLHRRYQIRLPTAQLWIINEQPNAPDQWMNKTALWCRTCSILTAFTHIWSKSINSVFVLRKVLIHNHMWI